MNIVDSGAWIEYVTDGPQAGFFASAIEKTHELLVPTVVMFDVFRHLVRHAGEGSAIEITAVMRQGKVIDLDATLAIEAARLASAHDLDAQTGTIMAIAARHDATVWTTDRRLAYLPNVRCKSAAASGV